MVDALKDKLAAVLHQKGVIDMPAVQADSPVPGREAKGCQNFLRDMKGLFHGGSFLSKNQFPKQSRKSPAGSLRLFLVNRCGIV